MTLRPLPVFVAIGLLALAGCAAGDELTAASTCHTSDGQFVAAPGCTISYSSSRTVTTSTTTTTTTVGTNAPAPSETPPPKP